MSEQYSIYLHRRKLELVGTLWLNNTRGHISSAFTYAPHWLKAPGAFALSPDLPLDQYPKACNELFLCFQDCSPDRWGRVLLQRQERLHARREARKPHALLISDYLCAFRTVHGRAPYVFLQMEERVFWRNPARNQSLPLYLCQNFFVPRNM